MKIKFIILGVVIMLLALIGSLFALNPRRSVKVVNDVKDVVLTRSLYKVTASQDEEAQRLTYMTYIAGFLDAIQLEEINAEGAKQFLKNCEGMTLGQLTDMMFKFYEQNPDLREKKPANILTEVIPQLRKIISPLSTEKK